MSVWVLRHHDAVALIQIKHGFLPQKIRRQIIQLTPDFFGCLLWANPPRYALLKKQRIEFIEKHAWAGILNNLPTTISILVTKFVPIRLIGVLYYCCGFGDNSCELVVWQDCVVVSSRFWLFNYFLWLLKISVNRVVYFVKKE